MPTVTFDISDKVGSLIDAGIKEGGPADFNPGQAAAYSQVVCTIQRATLSVRIRGRDVSVTTDIDVHCTGAPYISGAVASLQESANSMGSAVSNILDYSSYIGAAFASL